MKISLQLKSDSDNTYFENKELEIQDCGSDRIYLKLSDSDREVSVDKEEFLKTIKILCGE